MTAAITRWVLKETWKALDPLANPTDSDIEALHVFAPNAYPTALFPGNLFTGSFRFRRSSEAAKADLISVNCDRDRGV